MKISASIYSDKKRSLKDTINDLRDHHVDLLHIDCNDDLSVFDDIAEINVGNALADAEYQRVIQEFLAPPKLIEFAAIEGGALGQPVEANGNAFMGVGISPVELQKGRRKRGSVDVPELLEVNLKINDGEVVIGRIALAFAAHDKGGVADPHATKLDAGFRGNPQKLSKLAGAIEEIDGRRVTGQRPIV